MKAKILFVTVFIFLFTLFHNSFSVELNEGHTLCLRNHSPAPDSFDRMTFRWTITNYSTTDLDIDYDLYDVNWNLIYHHDLNYIVEDLENWLPLEIQCDFMEVFDTDLTPFQGSYANYLITAKVGNIELDENCFDIEFYLDGNLLETQKAEIIIDPKIGNDVTLKVENLGIPFHKESYANNVWDMQYFEGKIYFGHGNSSDGEPSINAGPVPVIAFDVETETFNSEYTVDEEQIDIYRIWEDTLYIPGHDPREGWELGNFYKCINGNWTKYRTIPDGVHTYDIYNYEDKLFAALGTAFGDYSRIVVSEDGGLTWSTEPGVNISDKYRIYNLFELNNSLYAFSYTSSGYFKKPFIYELNYDGYFTSLQDVNISHLFPGIPDNYFLNLRIVRPFYSSDHSKLIYIGVNYTNDHQWDPFGLYTATSVYNVENINLTEDTIPWEIYDHIYVSSELRPKPWDILYRNTCFYVLLSKKTEGNPGIFVIKVIASEDLESWREILCFKHSTFARSFELVNGDFYFGLGTDIGNEYNLSSYKSYTDDISPEAGTILRVKSEAYTSVPSSNVSTFRSFSLCQNYPNPFNSYTQIRFTLPKFEYITIKIYNLLGKEIVTLLEEQRPVGEYEITWNAKDLPSGIYICRLQAGEFIETKKLILQR